MANLYRSPLRVYMALAILSLIGIWSAFHLPVSLFPNSSKPYVNMCVGNDLSPEAFLRSYGDSIENQIRSISKADLQVEKITSNYMPGQACFQIEFKWGGSDDEATREMENLRASLLGRLPQEWRDQVWFNSGRESGGFLIMSFYSSQRSLNELYKILEPVLMPRMALVPDSQEPWLSNPQRRQVLIELKPDTLATFQLLPVDVGAAILSALESYSGGTLSISGSESMIVDFPRMASGLAAFKQIQVPTASGRSVSLSEIAKVDLTVPLDESRVMKTSGAPSVILWMAPKPGGNVKAMAEEVKKGIAEVMPSLPKDIQFKSLVDPSEFIASAVHNVAHEVSLAAGLAVLVLFLFVGNLKNVITAAIEIPLSLVLAFILMRISGMNLNLISLGGLALSAGMNVDASVVVMENIFRHFEAHGKESGGRALDFEERLAIIVAAVKEVQFAVIASTIASLVVFIPLAFTSDLSYAILGDLAKAVVFSHGFSAIVALILVPTIRLHVMKKGVVHEKPSLLEGFLQWLESAYSRALGVFLDRGWLRVASIAALAVLMTLLLNFALPKLPREVIGKPDTDSVWFGMVATGNTLVRQMEAQAEQVEHDIISSFPNEIKFTFTQISRPNNAWILLRLNDKSHMKQMLKSLEDKFPNTPMIRYSVDTWNPAELPLPNPPDFRVAIRGSDRDAMLEMARDIDVEFQERKIFSRTSIEPGSQKSQSVRVRPRVEQWPLLADQGVRLSMSSLASLTRTATDGHTISKIDLDGETMKVFMRFPEAYVGSPEDLSALPVGVGGRILPLKALAQIGVERSAAPIRRENGREAYLFYARGNQGEEALTKDKVKQATELIEKWPELMSVRKAKRLADQNEADAKKVAVGAVKDAQTTDSSPVVQIEDAQVELNDALKQLAFAVSLSIGLIFLTMVFQFGSVMNSLLVLVAVPLGFIGVLLSLFVFHSTLSLNSLLGVILLNGLAVANSIILVDFLQRKVRDGMAPRQAAVEVARVRLRPILMTSMTTGLGMLPVAMGFGEGGKILQPLGIAVAGGLGFSMVTTLFIVPALQVSWLEWQAKRNGRHA